MTETKPVKASYTPEQKRTAMELHASVNGRQDLLAKLLRQEGLDVKVSTVRDWATRRHRDEYETIRQGIEAYVRAHAAERYRSITSLAADVAEESLRQTMVDLQRGEVQLKDLPKAMQSAMVSAGIATDKDLVLNGQPNQIVGNSGDVGDLARSLGAVGVTLIAGGVNLTAQANDPSRTAIDVQTKQGALVSGDGQDDDGKEDGKSAGG